MKRARLGIAEQVGDLPALAELALVLWGAYSYWRAAVATTRARAPARLTRARVSAAALLLSGIVTLGLDLLGA